MRNSTNIMMEPENVKYKTKILMSPYRDIDSTLQHTPSLIVLLLTKLIFIFFVL